MFGARPWRSRQPSRAFLLSELPVPENPLDFPPTFAPCSLVGHGAETCPEKQVFNGTPISCRQVFVGTVSPRPVTARCARSGGYGLGTRRWSSSNQLSTTTRSAVATASSGVSASFNMKNRPSIGEM